MTNERRGRVLVVDDDPAMCQFLKDLLQQLGFDVDCARDGAKAMARLNEFNPDVVISDYVMPGMDGLTLLKAIAERRPATKVVLITGSPSVAVAVESIACGACDFVLKPINLDRLATLMIDVVGERRQAPRPA